MDIQKNASPEPIQDEDEKSSENSSKQMDIDELRKQLKLSQKRENLANLRLTVKEKQLRDLMDENESMKRNVSDENKADCTLVDQAVGVMFSAMRDEIRKARKDAKLATLELRALKNGPESSDTKALAALCKKLEKENTELKNEGTRTTRLETVLSYCRKTVEGLRKRCRDYGDVLAERNEEIKRLQAELARAHEENTRLQKNAGGTRIPQVQGDNHQISGQYCVVGGTDHHGSVSVVTNENEEVVSVSSRESAHEDIEFDDQVDRVLTPGASAAEAVNVSSPESVHGAPEPETISSDEQDVADVSSSKDSSIMEGCS
uniref:RAB6-interacting golgin n=1 Tax=Elaeophora elaphi TaxID=1147741 RepID=A0A0R3RPP7_9BILA